MLVELCRNVELNPESPPLHPHPSTHVALRGFRRRERREKSPSVKMATSEPVRSSSRSDLSARAWDPLLPAHLRSEPFRNVASFKRGVAFLFRVGGEEEECFVGAWWWWWCPRLTRLWSLPHPPGHVLQSNPHPLGSLPHAGLPSRRRSSVLVDWRVCLEAPRVPDVPIVGHGGHVWY